MSAEEKTRKKTEAVEEKVRKIVADYFTGMAKSAASLNPNLDDVIEKAVKKNIEKKLDEFVVKETLDIKQAYETQEEIFSSLKGFDYVESYLTDVKDGWLKSKEAYKEEYKDFLERIDVLGKVLGTDIAPSFVSAYDNILSYLQRKDKVISSLVKTAEKDGLEAVNGEMIRTAVKQEYPTAEDYIQSFRDLITASINLVHAWNNSVGMAKETIEIYVYCIADIYIDVFIKRDVKVLYE